MPQTSAQSIIEQARLKHPKFSVWTDGAALLRLNQIQRSYLLRYGRQIEALMNTSLEMAATIDGVLVGIDDLGVPYYVTTGGDGYAISFDDLGVPYVDPNGAVLTTDPYGENGGTPGFPLPASFVRITDASLAYEDGSSGPLDVVHERERHTAASRDPMAFVSGNRLVPVRAPEAQRSTDDWSKVTAVRLSYVALPSLAALTDTITMPDVLADCLVNGLAHEFAMSTADLSTFEKQSFERSAKLSEVELENFGTEVIGDASGGSVTYTG